jgi:NAD(P)-dependent dehydrogenase (short-subunit alcohol dehydrogenase family)
MDHRECEGRTALVTGASRGIGAAIAERLAAAGATVAVVARSLDSHPPKLPGTLRETVERITGRGGRAVAVRGDVSDAESRVEFFRRCQEGIGPIDILVNNAALGAYKPFSAFTADDFTTICDANLRAPFELCQLAAGGMRERKRGWIINISSATAELPAGPPFIPWEQMGGHLLYAASKAALNRLTVGLAAELYDDGIAVNALAPVAAVITPGVEALGVTAWIDESMREPVEAMAEAALALAICDPRTVTGQVAYSKTFLQQIGRPIRTLDGRGTVCA